MVKLSRRDLEIIAVALGGIDFYLEGALTKPVSRAFKAALARAKPVATRGTIAGVTSAARTLPRFAGTAARVGTTIALRHPVLTAGAVVYYTYKNREELADLLRQGYDVVQDIAETRQDFIERNPEQFIDLPFIGPVRPLGTPVRQQRRKSTYNLAVSKGLKALKKSTSYGKKGFLKTPKKAFGFVARTVSKLRKGKKVPSKGASGVVKRSLGNIKITVRKP